MILSAFPGIWGKECFYLTADVTWFTGKIWSCVHASTALTPNFFLCRKNTCPSSLFVKWKRFSTPEAGIINIVTLCNLQNVLSPLNNKPLTPERSFVIPQFEKVDIMDDNNK